jgi:uncharacterized protein
MSKLAFEFPAADLTRAKKFYQEVFGWEMKDLPQIDYTLVMSPPGEPADASQAPDPILGGITRRSELVKGPVVIITVASVDASLARVEAAGGKIRTPPERVGDFGLSSYVEDTEGNVLCLWESLK